ncbi:MAG: hypothetical protein V4579_08485 [Pseudomonadota bacterium]
MNLQEKELAHDRVTRDAARAVFNARLTRVRNALAQRGIGSRVLEEGRDRAKGTAEEAVAVARENRLIVAGTGLALLAWLVRRPVGRLTARAANRLTGREPRSRWVRLREWTGKRIRM